MPLSTRDRVLGMTHPLDGCIARLNRSEDHLQVVVERVNAFLAGSPGEMALELDRQRRPVVRVVEARTPEDDLSLAVGEYVYSVRSALDHLAYQLAVLHTGDPLPASVAKASQFPIAKSGPHFRRIAATQLKGVSAQARAAIERLQPYHRQKMPDAKALTLLNDLCNVDKHRMLHPTASMLVGSQFGIEATGYFELHRIDVFPRELRSGAMLARFAGRFDGDVTFTHNMGLDVVFGRDCAAVRARKQSVVATLAYIREFVLRELMPALTVFFDNTEYGVTKQPSTASS
jgi:hypothetical protein